jgi:hypothetical protein
MVTVIVVKPWTDEHGVPHSPGSRLQVPKSQADNLVADGWVRWTEPPPGGPNGG